MFQKMGYLICIPVLLVQGSSDRCIEKSCRGEVYTECNVDMVISHINLSSTTDDRCSVPRAYGHGENYIWVVRCAAVFQVCGVLLVPRTVNRRLTRVTTLNIPRVANTTAASTRLNSTVTSTMKTHSMPVMTSADSKASTDSVSTLSTAGPTMKTHSMPVVTSADSKASTDSVSTMSTAGPTMKTHSMPVVTSADSKAPTDSVSTVSTAGPTIMTESTTPSMTTTESTVLNYSTTPFKTVITATGHYSTTPFMAVNTATGQNALIAILIPALVGGVVVLVPLIGCVYFMYKKIHNKVSTSIREC